MSEREPLLRVDDIAEWLDVDRLRVYELARTGLLPAVRLGRAVRFSPDAVRRFIEAGGTRDGANT
jgi:excisionase family DNA binding protein